MNISATASSAAISAVTTITTTTTTGAHSSGYSTTSHTVMANGVPIPNHNWDTYFTPEPACSDEEAIEGLRAIIKDLS